MDGIRDSARHMAFARSTARGRGPRHCRAATLGVALAAGLLIAACQGESDSAGSPSPEPDEAWWEVENRTGQEFIELNLIESPVVEEDWGPNQLGDDTTLPDSELFRLREVPCPQTYDQRVVGASGDMAYRYEVEFGCERIVDWEVKAFE